MQQTALSFSKEGRCIVKLATNILRFASSSWQVMTPQLMGITVGRLHRRLHITWATRARRDGRNGAH